MPKIIYKTKRFNDRALAVITRANQILHEYGAQGYDLTLRQLYYQFVARGLIPNTDREYKRLGSIVNDARMAGKIDWDHITDRTRFLRSIGTWSSPDEIIRSAARSYRENLWRNQPDALEVWIEKDALVGVIAGVCEQEGVSYLSCRGYTSQSEMWQAAQRLGRKLNAGKNVTILHLGDHDPSGIDMSRDIEDRLWQFLVHDLVYAAMDDRGVTRVEPDDPIMETAIELVNDRFHVERLALNMEQVEEYDPPPNPAKVTDSRAAGYIAEHGDESWELDALEPRVIEALIRDAVEERRDGDLWEADTVEQEEHQSQLEAVHQNWDTVVRSVT